MLGLLQVEFTPNGSFNTLTRCLKEYDPHLLHCAGHGSFVDTVDSGVLLLEAENGPQRTIPNSEFAEGLLANSDSLRLVFLSACQSAKVSRNTAYADLGPRLLSMGIPAVVAMQYRVFNRSAIQFGGSFYQVIAEGKPIDTALAESRQALKQGSPNGVDFATPVLYLSDPLCLQVDAEAARRKARPAIPTDMGGVTVSSRFAGRSAELRELQTHLDPQHSQWRAAVIFGMGGMGKTVLAARLAGRMAGHLEGVKTIRLSPATTAQSILDQLGAFLLVHNARSNQPAISQFNQVKDQPLPLETKAGLLAEILKQLKLLVVFDNCEDILPEGRSVSKAIQLEANPAFGAIDPELSKLLSLLVRSVPGPSRFLFTSRVDFEPVEPGRLAGEIGHLDLGELRFREAVYLMETLPPLDQLPVVILPDDRGSVQGISMRDVYARLGGHPYTLGLFVQHAAHSSVGKVLDDLRGVQKELLEFTLMEGAAAKLSEKARLLLRRGAIYNEPVPVEGLAYLLGDEQDCMPKVGGEVKELQRWGLLAQHPGTQQYAFHQLVTDWALQQMKDEERAELLHRAADYWIGVGRESVSLNPDLNPELNAWHYLQAAGGYEEAYEVLDWNHSIPAPVWPDRAAAGAFGDEPGQFAGLGVGKRAPHPGGCLPGAGPVHTGAGALRAVPGDFLGAGRTGGGGHQPVPVGEPAPGSGRVRAGAGADRAVPGDYRRAGRTGGGGQQPAPVGEPAPDTGGVRPGARVGRAVPGDCRRAGRPGKGVPP